MEDKRIKLVRRLKSSGLVPKSAAIRIDVHRSPSSKVKWEAVNAVTNEPFKVGGTSGIADMVSTEWVTAKDDDWTVLSMGAKLPPTPREGRGPNATLKGWA